MAAIAEFWRDNGEKRARRCRPTSSTCLTREVLRTELMRIKALIATAVVSCSSFLAVDVLAPDAVRSASGVAA